MIVLFFGTGLAQVHGEARDGYMNHVGLDLTFLNSDAGKGAPEQPQGSEWRGDLLAQLFSFDLDLERYMGTGEPSDLRKHLQGFAESPLLLDSQGDDSRTTQSSVFSPEANPEITPSSAQTLALLSTEEAARVERPPTESEGGEGRTSEAGVEVVPGRSGVVRAGQEISTSLSGFNGAVADWRQEDAIAWHLGRNPAEVFVTGSPGEREASGGIVPGRVSANQGSEAHQIVNSQGRAEIVDSASRQGAAEPSQIEVTENPRDLVSQLSSSAATKHTHILQDRVWLPNGGAALAEGVTKQWMDRAGQGGKTVAESPSVPASRTVSEVADNSEGPDVTRYPPEAVTTERPSAPAPGGISAAESRNQGQDPTPRLPDSAASERPDTSASGSASRVGSDGEEHDGTRRPAKAGTSGSDASRGSASAEETYSFGRPAHKSDDVWRFLNRLALPPNLGPALRGFPGREGSTSTRGGPDEITDSGWGQGKAGVGSKRGPESGSETKSRLEHAGTSRSRPRSFPASEPKGANPLERSVRAQTLPSPKQTPQIDSVEKPRSDESTIDRERTGGTGSGSRGLTQASSGPPRAVEPSASQEGIGRPTTARPLTGTAESSSQTEQAARSAQDSAPEFRPRDAAWKSSQQGSEEDSQHEVNSVRMDRDSRSQSQDTRGEKVPLPSPTGRVPSESSVGRRSVNWPKKMSGPTVDAGAERRQPVVLTKEGQPVAKSPGVEPEASHVSAPEGRILKEGLGARSTLPASQSNPATLLPGRGEREISQERVQVPASQVLGQSDPVVDQNAKSAIDAWARTSIVLGQDPRGENRERQRQSPRDNASVEQATRPGQATRPVSPNLWPDESIRNGVGVPLKAKEHPEPEPDTRQPKKAFPDSEQEDSHRSPRTEDKVVDPKDYSSERVWKAGERNGVFQAGTADRAVDLSLSPKGTSLEAGNPSQGQDVTNSSGRSSGGSELSRQSIPVWLQNPTAFVDSVANQFVQHSRFLRNGETVRFDIELRPEFLGKIRIKTSLNHKNELAVEIRVDDPDVREALERRLPALVEKLQGMGLEPDRLKVDGFSSHSQSDGQQQEGHRRDQPGALKNWSQLGADEGEEELPEWPEWPEGIEDEGIHYFA